jgi:hypothetical protein
MNLLATLRLLQNAREDAPLRYGIASFEQPVHVAFGVFDAGVSAHAGMSAIIEILYRFRGCSPCLPSGKRYQSAVWPCNGPNDQGSACG